MYPTLLTNFSAEMWHSNVFSPINIFISFINTLKKLLKMAKIKPILVNYNKATLW